MSLKYVAKTVLELLERGVYLNERGEELDFSEAQRACVEGTRLYTPEELTELASARKSKEKAVPVVRLLDVTTQEAAQQLAGQGDTLLLNFASARNPGGGFLKGAKAQEEDLCRCSGLYPALLSQPRYYEVNRRTKSLIYTDHMIYSPKVPFFKIKGRGPMLDKPFFCSVLTAPAPNSAELRKDPDALPRIVEAFDRRWAHVLRLAKAEGYSRLILGAWGCGAFGNEPGYAAKSVRTQIERVGAGLDEIVFAIPNRGTRGKRNHEAFSQAFSEMAIS